MAHENDLTLLEIMRRYSTDEAARAYFERMRWPKGAVCPHCGSSDKIYALTPNKKARIREGLYKCGTCDERFSVTVGTVMEASKIPLHKWLTAFYIMCARKTQVSALQLQRQLELGSYHTALFLCHRIRFALKGVSTGGKLVGEVEADEAYIGSKARGKGRGYTGNKVALVSVVECGGDVRSTVVQQRVNSMVIETLLKRHVADEPHLNTNESPLHNKAGKRFASHARVNHSAEEYGYYDYRSGRNAELDFKYNTRKESDGERTSQGIRRIEGKRLMYRPKVSS